MKRSGTIKLISICLIALMLLSISGCGSNNTGLIKPREYMYDETAPDGDKVPSGGFRVGFGRTEILPEDSIPLQGYGDTLTRMSTGFLDVLYVSCIAVTDEDDKTLLMITADITGAKAEITKSVRDYVKEHYDIDPEYVHMTATHTHSGPNLTETQLRSVVSYLGKFRSRIYEAINIAMADRKTAEIQVGETKTKGMNYDRHYWRSDGTATSDHYGIFSSAPIVSHIDDPDETMRLIKFTRKKSDGSKAKDVLLVNWQVHPHISGSAQLTDASSDLLGPFIREIEATKDCYCAYYQGCAGNMNERSRISSDEDNVKDGYVAYGKKLASFALSAYDKLDKMEAGKIKAKNSEFTYKANHDQDHLLAGAREILSLYNQTHSTVAIESLLHKYQIHSIYQTRAIIRCAGFGETYTMPISAFSIGDIGFTTASCEEFCQTGMYIREHSPFKFTVTLSYTDDHNSYLPTAEYYDAGCYEVTITNYSKGGAEKCAEQQVEMLKELKAEK